MSSRLRVPNNRAGSNMSRLRTVNDGQEIVVAGMRSTGKIMSLLYSGI